MVMDRLAKQQIKRKIMFATETDHEKANSIFRGKTLRDDGIVFVKSSLTYIIHSGFISGYQNRYGDNLKPPTNVYHRMTA